MTLSVQQFRSHHYFMAMVATICHQKPCPPLKFHSGFLGKHSLSTLNLHESNESTASNDSNDDCDECIASAPYDLDGYCSNENFEQEFSWFPNFGKIIGLHTSSNVRNRPPALILNRGSSKIILMLNCQMLPRDI